MTEYINTDYYWVVICSFVLKGSKWVDSEWQNQKQILVEVKKVENQLYLLKMRLVMFTVIVIFFVKVFDFLYWHSALTDAVNIAEAKVSHIKKYWLLEYNVSNSIFHFGLIISLNFSM